MSDRRDYVCSWLIKNKLGTPMKNTGSSQSEDLTSERYSDSISSSQGSSQICRSKSLQDIIKWFKDHEKEDATTNDSINGKDSTSNQVQETNDKNIFKQPKCLPVRKKNLTRVPSDSFLSCSQNSLKSVDSNIPEVFVPSENLAINSEDKPAINSDTVMSSQNSLMSNDRNSLVSDSGFDVSSSAIHSEECSGPNFDTLFVASQNSSIANASSVNENDSGIDNMCFTDTSAVGSTNLLNVSIDIGKDKNKKKRKRNSRAKVRGKKVKKNYSQDILKNEENCKPSKNLPDVTFMQIRHQSNISKSDVTTTQLLSTKSDLPQNDKDAILNILRGSQQIPELTRKTIESLLRGDTANGSIETKYTSANTRGYKKYSNLDELELSVANSLLTKKSNVASAVAHFKTQLETLKNKNNNDKCYDLRNIRFSKNFVEKASQQRLIELEKEVVTVFDENRINLNLVFTDDIQFIKLVHIENKSLAPDFRTYASQYHLSQISDVSEIIQVVRFHTVIPSKSRDVDMFERVLRNPEFLPRTDYCRVNISAERDSVLIKIRNIFSDLYSNLQDDNKNNKSLVIQYPNYQHKDNVIFKDNILCLRDDIQKFSNIYRHNQRSRKNFQLSVLVLRKIYNLLKENRTENKRQIFYEYFQYVNKQATLDRIFDIISCKLNVPLYRLGITATAKGLVYGNLKLHFIDGTIYNFSNEPGLTIPSNFYGELVTLESDAEFILLVEKDTVYQHLVRKQIKNKLFKPFILVTGKGCGDTSTKLFLNMTSRLLKIPVYILVDADPYGIDIMLQYRFGATRSSYLSKELAIPHAAWIGIFPNEIRELQMSYRSLNNKDKSRIRSMINRPYMKHCRFIKEQLQYMLLHNIKAEIEGIMHSNKFIGHLYLPNKLKCGDFI